MTCPSPSSLWARRIPERPFGLSLTLRLLADACFDAGRTGLWIAATALLMWGLSETPGRAQEGIPSTPVLIKKESKGNNYLYWFAARGENTSETFLFSRAAQDGLIHTEMPLQFRKPGSVLEVLDRNTNKVARIPVALPPNAMTVTDSDFKYVRTVPIKFKNTQGSSVKDLLITLKYFDKNFGLVKEQYYLSEADTGIAHFMDVPLNAPFTVSVRYGDKLDFHTFDKLVQDSTGNWTAPYQAVTWPAVPITKSTEFTINDKNLINRPGVRPGYQGPIPGEAQGGSTGQMATIFAGIIGILLLAVLLFWAFDSGRMNGVLAKMGIQVTPGTGARPAVATGPSPIPSPARRPAPRPVSSEAVTSIVGESNIGGTGPRLVATLGPYAGSIFPLNEPNVAVGRDVDNNVALTQDSAASRRHAHIQASNGQFVLVDDGSSNGTYVNGVRMASKKPQTLRPGDEVQIGTTRFRFEA